MIKIGDTPADMGEGRNAGMWTIGFALSGNQTGLTREQVAGVARGRLRALRQAATRTLLDSGAHYVVDGPWDCLGAILEIAARMRAGHPPPG